MVAVNFVVKELPSSGFIGGLTESLAQKTRFGGGPDRFGLSLPRAKPTLAILRSTGKLDCVLLYIAVKCPPIVQDAID
jgi:hypothetical protein